jgi:hypothetical protein
MQNYIQQVKAELAELLPNLSGKPELLSAYAQLALTTGMDTTMENVHDAWSVVTDAARPDHAAIVPFEDLDHQTQERDRKYMEAIYAVANRRFYNPAPAPQRD